MRKWMSNYTALFLRRRSVRTRKALLGSFMVVAIVGDSSTKVLVLGRDASTELVDIARNARGDWREFMFNVEHMAPR